MRMKDIGAFPANVNRVCAKCQKKPPLKGKAYCADCVKSNVIDLLEMME